MSEILTRIHRKESEYLVDFQEAVNLAAFVLLLLHLLCEALPLTLLDGVGTLERPASPPVCLPHIVTSVTASAHTKRKQVNTGLYRKHKERKSRTCVYLCLCVCVLLEVFSLSSIAALTSVWVQCTGVKHFTIISLTKFYTKKKNTKSSL